jgi:endonuclease/exonuclease/phosphatase (EEP) superfamily protein YafD
MAGVAVPLITQEISSAEGLARRHHAAVLAGRGAVGLLLALTLAGFLGPWWWVFDLAANLRLHVAVAMLMLIVVLAIGGSRIALAAAAIGAMLNLAVAVPAVLATQFGTPEPADPAADGLDVTFFNTKFRADRTETIAELTARNDDVVVLALAGRGWVRDLQAAELDLHVHAGLHRDRDHPLELVVLTRDPAARVVVHRLTDDPRDALVELTVERDGGPIHVLAGHPTSPLTPDRAARRDAMLRWMTEWTRAQDEPVVVMGDLNATVWSAPFRRMLRDADLTDSRIGFGLQPSWPAKLGPVGITIDHVLHSDQLTTLDRRLVRVDGSDHAMVQATIARRPPGST